MSGVPTTNDGIFKMAGWGGARAGAGRPRGPWPLLPWRRALQIAAMRRDSDGARVIDRAARVLITAATAGDLRAIREVGDRLDGRAKARRQRESGADFAK
jgi:hypothetical protein